MDKSEIKTEQKHQMPFGFYLAALQFHVTNTMLHDLIFPYLFHTDSMHVMGLNKEIKTQKFLISSFNQNEWI